MYQSSNGDQQDGKEIYCAGAILFALRSHYVQAVAISAALVDGGFDLDAQDAGLIVMDMAFHSYVVSSEIAQGL
ncbi:MAG: hypothetical protein WB799_11015 [Candidatus Sulfotelmatobacter sp.]